MSTDSGEPAVPGTYSYEDDVDPICGHHKRSRCQQCGSCTSCDARYRYCCTSCDACYCGED
ncbi:hypothetical protein [Amycolatopsis alkalitolerans]|uniref:Uncharacterized protein n=1 Tax=Amycolatopsis alkalitolerans TaxID=2547244 RepID=A0A5C4LPA6_9PSEU|nr:hypothetical protein [Amycolatopsis alkalitolerans]TNC19085.1 hypothetical protein FG385_32995 [Amycolatopsis alkalitolerans]